MHIPGQTLAEKVLLYVFPASLLETTPWLAMWREREKLAFLSTARVFFPLTALLYLSHYYFFDIPMGLEPSEYWLYFRLSMVGLSAFAFIFYIFIPETIAQYRLVGMAVTATFCISQAYVTVYYPQAPWLYCYVFVIVSALFLRASVVKSLFFAIIVIALQLPALMTTGLTVPEAMSAIGVTVIALIILRGPYMSDIINFYLSQSNLEAQRRNIELSIELSDRIKFFIPRKIANRMDRLLSSNDTSVVSAVYEVLKPKKQDIACLFSDIRGFTEASRELDSFVKETAIPNMKLCTEAIDRNGGIPRKIGDLIFGYFDEASLRRNVIEALAAGLEIAKINARMNVDSAHSINRYILISSGEAIVGNIGGLDSSVDITALGSPVNFLSRLDEITKNPKISSLLKSSDVVLSENTYKLLIEHGVNIDARLIDLCAMGVEIRNFSTEKRVYCLTASEHNCQVVRIALTTDSTCPTQTDEHRFKAA